MKQSTKELALCGVMTALSVVLLCLGGVIPLAVYACPMLASCALLVLRERCSARYAWCCWLAVAILTLLLGPDKEAAALYLFLAIIRCCSRSWRPSGGLYCAGWQSWR